VRDFPVADQAWFEMASIRRRCLSDAVWVPVRLTEWIGEVGRVGYEGYRAEFFGLGSIAVPLGRRADADKLGWSEIGIGHQHVVYASKERYTPAEVYQYRDGDDLGIELVLEQGFDGGAAPSVWHLNQDFVMALGLLREKDEWIRPSEDYCVVARLRRNADSQPIACEIKNEFLRDYLAARKMALRLTYYRIRELITKEANHITWPDGGLKDSGEQHRFEGRVFPIIEGGHPIDGGYAVFRISRTDVDPEEDVPRPGPESDANTASESWRGEHKGRKLMRVMGELWRNEWIEPGTNSIRVRGD